MIRTISSCPLRASSPTLYTFIMTWGSYIAADGIAAMFENYVISATLSTALHVFGDWDVGPIHLLSFWETSQVFRLSQADISDAALIVFNLKIWLINFPTFPLSVTRLLPSKMPCNASHFNLKCLLGLVNSTQQAWDCRHLEKQIALMISTVHLRLRHQQRYCFAVIQGHKVQSGSPVPTSKTTRSGASK